MHRSSEQVLLVDLRSEWGAESYSILDRNCNDFSVAFVQRLRVQRKIPGWINRAARLGRTLLPGTGTLAIGDDSGCEQHTYEQQQADVPVPGVARCHRVVGSTTKNTQPDVLISTALQVDA